ncbi:unnamed protein product [Prorocentrum cordatum]|uniref:Uncharacterized protein n=1 Tax=Prorocentrum cordatum TaxID=2364126 RepID=A0ABN9U9I9_9DINO|nr:unnamed protein product [Polarella glacialis]
MHQLPRFQRQRLTSEHLSVVWLEVPPKTHCTGCNCWGPLGRAPAGAGPRPRSLAARRIRSGRCPQSAGSSGSGVGERSLRFASPSPVVPFPGPAPCALPLSWGWGGNGKRKARREGAGRRGAERAEGGGGACRALRSLRRPQRKPPDSAQAAEAPRPGAGGPCHPTDVRARQAELG